MAEFTELAGKGYTGRCMSNETTVAGQSRRVHDPVRRWLIRLGWLGWALWVLGLGAQNLKIELADAVNLSFAFHLLWALLGWLGPVALALHFRASLMWAPLRYALMGIAAFLVIPAILASLNILFFIWIEHDVKWEDEQLLYESVADADIRVVAQSRYDGFPTNDPAHRIVKLTPVLGLWQFAEPVDTTAFNPQGWKRRF
jgi:hypothetical protein